MGIPRDLIDVLRECAAAEVKFLILGGHAHGFHAVPRFTEDVDCWLDPKPGHLERAVTALSNSGAPRETLEALKALFGLLALKRATGRSQDLADALLLEEERTS